MSYQKLEIEDYLNLPKIKDLPQEVKDEIRRVRTEFQYMSYEMFHELLLQRQICRTRKLKYARSIWVDEQGTMWYFNHYHSKFEFCGYFHSEEFLKERSEKEATERKEIENRKMAKKLAKQQKQIPEVKQKRKRISK